MRTWRKSCFTSSYRTAFTGAATTVPAAAQPPDTNIVCFLAKQKGVRSLGRTNALNHRIYRQFTIEEKVDEPEAAYVQPFFLSRTHFKSPAYSKSSVAELLRHADLDAGEYEREGIFVLRATLMTPYIRLAEELGRSQRYLSQFMQKLRQRVDAAIAGEPNAEAPRRL